MNPLLRLFAIRNEAIKLLAENIGEFVYNLEEGKHP